MFRSRNEFLVYLRLQRYYARSTLLTREGNIEYAVAARLGQSIDERVMIGRGAANHSKNQTIYAGDFPELALLRSPNKPEDDGDQSSNEEPESSCVRDRGAVFKRSQSS
jgi:hypothetical protein